MDVLLDGGGILQHAHHKNFPGARLNEETQNGSFTGDFTTRPRAKPNPDVHQRRARRDSSPGAGNVGLGRRQGGPERPSRRGLRSKVNMLLGGQPTVQQRRAVLQVTSSPA